MTCIAGLKTKYGTIIGADTRASDSVGNFSDGVLKVFQFPYGRQGIACCGSVKALNYVSVLDSLIDYKDILDNINIDLNYMIRNISPVLEVIQEETKESGNSVFIVGTDKKLFTVYGDASVIEEIKPFCAQGSNGSAALSVLEAGYHEDIDIDEAIDLIVIAIQAAGANNSTSNLEVDYIVIPTEEYEKTLIENIEKDPPKLDSKEDSNKESEDECSQ